MKRLDLIYELVTELNKWNCLPKEEATHGDNGYIANNLLTKLEELGMAPPEIVEQVKTSVIVATPLGYQEMIVEDSKVFVRKWEDET